MLKIHNLTKTEELDRNAMQAIKAGYSLRTSDSQKIQDASDAYMAWFTNVRYLQLN
jgi:hypothetical protein